MNNPNVVFFIVDQLNYRDLGYMNHPVVKTPNLDKLRGDSVHFARCYVQNAFCLPSRVSYLSGQYLFHHRQYGFTGLLDEKTPCMAAHFRDNGYDTFHVGKLHVNPYGENLGFDRLIPTIPEDIYQSTDIKQNYQVHCQENGGQYPNDQVQGDDYRFPGIKRALPGLGFVGPSEVPAADSIETYTAEHAIEFINAERDAPFFAHVSFDRPHGPWSPSPEYADLYPPEDIPLPDELVEEELSRMPQHVRGYVTKANMSTARMGAAKMREILSLYYALITHIDHEIGRILAALRDNGLYENTVVVFCADHGDMAGHKGLFDKYSNKIYHDDIIRTPMLVKLPKEQAGGLEVPRVTESIDVFPTLCDICSLPTDNLSLDGTSLVPLTADATSSDWDNQAFSESYAIKTLIKDNLKLVYYVNSQEGELYDLDVDPDERDNLFADPARQDDVLKMKLAIVRLITEPVSTRRQEFIRTLFDDREPRSVGAIDKLFKWDKGIVEGGGFWMLFRDGNRMTYIPFDEELRFEKCDGVHPGGSSWQFSDSDDRHALHACADELIDYISTKIRPISIMTGSREERDNMLRTRGQGFR